MSAENLLTINQAAAKLGLHSCSVRQLCHDGKLRFMRFGPNNGRYRIRPEWIDAYLDSCIQEPGPGVQPNRKRRSIDSPASTQSPGEYVSGRARLLHLKQAGK
ncbi:MAG: helix-turn-helix domain-containing protein [Planctomycetaceae bacterium]